MNLKLNYAFILGVPGFFVSLLITYFFMSVYSAIIWAGICGDNPDCSAPLWIGWLIILIIFLALNAFFIRLGYLTGKKLSDSGKDPKKLKKNMILHIIIAVLISILIATPLVITYGGAYMAQKAWQSELDRRYDASGALSCSELEKIEITRLCKDDSNLYLEFNGKVSGADFNIELIDNSNLVSDYIFHVSQTNLFPLTNKTKNINQIILVYSGRCYPEFERETFNIPNC